MVTTLVSSTPSDEPADPGSRGSTRRLIARWLIEHVGEGGVFTIEDVEKMLQAQGITRRREADRRVRELREIRWQIGNYLTDKSLTAEQHRLIKIGDDLLDPHFRWPQGRRPSARIRRIVYRRDNSTCVLCGVQAGQAYPDEPNRRVRLSLGRILPGSKGGSYTIANCRVECERCQNTQDKYDYGGEAA